MQDFIQSVVSRLGISENQAQSATGGLLNYMKSQGDGGEVQGLIAKLPGAEELMRSAGTGAEGGTEGMLGGLAGKVGGGGGALAALQGSGLDPSRAGSFVKMLVDYAKEKAGPEQVDRVLEKVPGLKSLI